MKTKLKNSCPTWLMVILVLVATFASLCVSSAKQIAVITCGEISLGLHNLFSSSPVVMLANKKDKGSNANAILMGGAIPIAESRGGLTPNMIYLANEGSDILSEAQARQTDLANSDRVEEATFQQGVETYAQGILDRATEMEILRQIAPQVDVAERFEYATEGNAQEEFLAITDDSDIRAINSDFKRLEPTSAKVNSKTLQKGLTVRRDKRQLTGPNAREKVASWLMRILLRTEIKRALDLWNTASNTAKVWDDSANPDKDLLDLIESATNDGGVAPNFGLMGSGVWPLRYGSLTDAARGTTHPNAAFTEEQLKSFLGLDKLIRNKNRFVNKKTASSKSKMLGDSFIVGYLEDTPMAEGDPSNVKRFVSAPDGEGNLVEGMRIHILDDHPIFTDFIVEHQSILAKTHSKGLKKYTITDS